ncbi:hypothetical protein FBY03_10860 [Pseudomonas sp. SJZ079]|nr:hypothetical protein FBY03_10860 [Pseudomonas sp. SJZ079]
MASCLLRIHAVCSVTATGIRHQPYFIKQSPYQHIALRTIRAGQEQNL